MARNWRAGKPTGANEIWNVRRFTFRKGAAAGGRRTGRADPGAIQNGSEEFAITDERRKYRLRCDTISRCDCLLRARAENPGRRYFRPHRSGNRILAYRRCDRGHHAMITAMLATRNILAGKQKYDVWAVNEDGEYQESGRTDEHLGKAAKRIAAAARS